MQPNANLRPLVDAVHAATGRRPSLSSVLRWCHRGVNGHYLNSWKVGGRRLTTVEAVLEFVEATTQASQSRPAVGGSSGRKPISAHEAAMRTLEKQGI